MSRGALFMLALLAGVLIAFPVGAAVALGPDPQASPVAQKGFGEGITWFTPDQATVGQPVHAAVAVLVGDGFATSMHEDLSIWVTLNDDVVFHTDNVHEHHGLHLLTVTPTEPGVLRFWADDGSGGDHDHLEGPDALGGSAPQAAPTPHGVSAEVEIHGESWSAQELTRHDYWLDMGTGTMGNQWTMRANATLDEALSGLLSVSDEEGRLVVSAWPTFEGDNARVNVPTHAGFTRATALFTPHPSSTDPLFSSEVSEEFTLEGSMPPLDPLLQLPSAEPLPGCAEAPGRLVLDPNSLLDESVVVWQEWSDVRLHYLHPDRVADPASSSVKYTLAPWPIQSEHAFEVKTDHPFGYVALRPPSPGVYQLTVALEQDGEHQEVCALRLHVLPDPAGVLGAGQLDVGLSVDGRSLSVALESQDSDAEALPHYEFDAQVVRLADENPAWLAWRGKLHGHAGQVAFSMHDLLPGEYELRVFPSPQDAGIAPLAAGEPGFVYPFSVGGSFEGSGEWDQHEEVPLPVMAFVILLVLGLFVLRGSGPRFRS